MNSEISQIIFKLFLENKFSNEELDFKVFEEICKVIKEKPFDRDIFYKTHCGVFDKESINHSSSNEELDFKVFEEICKVVKEKPFDGDIFYKTIMVFLIKNL